MLTPYVSEPEASACKFISSSIFPAQAYHFLIDSLNAILCFIISLANAFPKHYRNISNSSSLFNCFVELLERLTLSVGKKISGGETE